jgi:hypothetical protein
MMSHLVAARPGLKWPGHPAGQNGGVSADPALTLASTPWFGQGYEPPWSPQDPGEGYGSSEMESSFDEYGDPQHDMYTLPDLEGPLLDDWNVGLAYQLTSPASVFGLATSQADFETESQWGTAYQWWNANILSYAGGAYAGYDPELSGPTTNGVGLDILLTRTLYGVVEDLPVPPATNLVPAGLDGGSAPPRPEAAFWDTPPPASSGDVPGPQSAATPVNNAEQPQAAYPLVQHRRVACHQGQTRRSEARRAADRE